MFYSPQSPISFIYLISRPLPCTNIIYLSNSTGVFSSKAALLILTSKKLTWINEISITTALYLTHPLFFSKLIQECLINPLLTHIKPIQVTG